MIDKSVGHADTVGIWGNGPPKGIRTGPVTITRSVFTKNVSQPSYNFDDFSLQGGGAIFAVGVSVSIDSTNFTTNQARFSGGAIRFLGSIGTGLGPRSPTVTNSVFGQNTAFDWPLPPPYGSIRSSGGAIAAGSFYPPDQPTNVDPVSISDTRFEANLATFGSAIVTSERISLTRSTLIANVARSAMGAALVVRNQPATVRLTKFLNNVGGGCAT